MVTSNLERQRVIPPIHGPMEKVFDYGDKLDQIVDGYRPWDQVHATLTLTSTGNLLEISDTYLPPAQRPGGVKMDERKRLLSNLVEEIDARVPSTVMYDFWNSGTGYPTVAWFNSATHSGNSIRSDSPHFRVAAEWRRRLGVTASHYEWPAFTVRSGNTDSRFKFVHEQWTNGGSVYGSFGELGISEMSYACALIAHHEEMLAMNPNEYRFVQAQPSDERSTGYFFAVARTADEPKVGTKQYDVLTTCFDTVDLLFKSLKDPEDQKILHSIPWDRLGHEMPISLLDFIAVAKSIDRQALRAAIPEQILATNQRKKDADAAQDRFLILHSQAALDLLQNALTSDEGMNNFIYILSRNRYLYGWQDLGKLLPTYDVYKPVARKLADELTSVTVKFAGQDNSFEDKRQTNPA